MEMLSESDYRIPIGENLYSIARKENKEPIEILKFCIENDIYIEQYGDPWKEHSVCDIVMKNVGSIEEASNILGCSVSTMRKSLMEKSYNVDNIPTFEPADDFVGESKTIEMIPSNVNPISFIFSDDLYGLDFEHYVYRLYGKKYNAEKAYYIGQTKNIIQRLKSHIRNDVDSVEVNIILEGVDVEETTKEKSKEMESKLFKETIMEKNTTEVYGGR